MYPMLVKSEICSYKFCCFKPIAVHVRLSKLHIPGHKLHFSSEKSWASFSEEAGLYCVINCSKVSKSIQ
jgi:hypothetical protein